MDIRAYTEQDEQGVVNLWTKVFQDSPSWNEPANDIRLKLQVQRELFFVAANDDEIVGTAMAGYDGHRGWVYYCAVDPEYRRQGIGRALVEKAEMELVALGCPKLNLQVRAANNAAIEFYRRLGYQVEARVSMSKRL